MHIWDFLSERPLFVYRASLSWLEYLPVQIDGQKIGLSSSFISVPSEMAHFQSTVFTKISGTASVLDLYYHHCLAQKVI